MSMKAAQGALLQLILKVADIGVRALTVKAVEVDAGIDQPRLFSQVGPS